MPRLTAAALTIALAATAPSLAGCSSGPPQPSPFAAAYSACQQGNQRACDWYADMHAAAFHWLMTGDSNVGVLTVNRGPGW
jgi:hypothetical protein